MFVFDSRGIIVNEIGGNSFVYINKNIYQQITGLSLSLSLPDTGRSTELQQVLHTTQDRKKKKKEKKEEKKKKKKKKKKKRKKNKGSLKKKPTDALNMILQSSHRKQIVGNSLLFHFVDATFSLFSTVFEISRHKGG